MVLNLNIYQIDNTYILYTLYILFCIICPTYYNLLNLNIFVYIFFLYLWAYSCMHFYIVIFPNYDFFFKYEKTSSAIITWCLNIFMIYAVKTVNYWLQDNENIQIYVCYIIFLSQVKNGQKIYFALNTS